MIDNIKIYDLEESIAASGYPMRTATNQEIDIIRETIENGTFGKTANTRDIYRRAFVLGNSAGGHDQYLTGIRVSFDVTFSNKAWVEAERYRFLEFVSSQSTMHRMCKFNLLVQYNEYVDPKITKIIRKKVREYNEISERLEALKLEMDRDKEIEETSKELQEKYLEILYSNPAGFLITARLTTNYRCLKNIYKQRHNHKLPEWREFCRRIRILCPYFEEFCLKGGRIK